GATWNGAVSAPNDPADTLGGLAVEGSVDEVRVKERGSFGAAVDQLAATIEFHDVGPDDSGMWGLRGVGSFEGSVERATVKTEGATAASKGAASLAVNLARHEISGNLPLAFLSVARKGHDRITLKDATLDAVAREPTHWTTAGSPALEAAGSIGRVSIGNRHFRAPKSVIRVQRTQADRYSLHADLAVDHVSWGKFTQAPKSTLSIEALVDAARPALDADVAFSIAGKVPTTLSVNASHDAPRTRYRLSLEGTEAGPILGALLFGDGGLRSDEFSFAFESRGSFKGLISKDRGGSLALAREPLRTTRGTHHSELRVERLALQRVGLTHQLQGLLVGADSTHEAPGHGELEVTASLTEARYGEVERPMSMHDFTQRVQIAYAALHGAPSLSIATKGSLARFLQPYVHQYPVGDVSFGADLDVDDTHAFAVRHAFFHNVAGGTKFEARGAYEGWSGAIRETEVCRTGALGCPEVASMYGREAATVAGTFEQDFSFWKSTDRTQSGGSLIVPFTLESGDLNTYRVTATAQFQDLMLELPQIGLLIDDLDALVPIDQEFATAPEFFIVPAKAGNAMAQKRFFDLYPFTARDSYFTVNRIQLGLESLGPVAANLYVVGSTMAMEQLHAAYRGGFITGQFLADLNQKRPKIMFRGHLTGVRVEDGNDVLDANLAMTFVPTTLIVEGKAQIVRVSKDHLYEIIDVLDPYHEDEDLNRVRLGLKFGYPKFVLIKLDEGLMNAKIDLGGLAGAIRIDEIKGIPVTPFLEQYVQPYIELILSPSLRYDAERVQPAGAPRVSQRPESEE
ncbi:MAG: hypothetical protein WBG86_07840, partial [Polyangiales bacterium]